jgi:murein L,D-transpeptidase YafK
MVAVRMIAHIKLVCRVLLITGLAIGAGAQTVFADSGMADQVIVKKSERKLYLMSGEDVLQSFDIALGLVPEGHKVQEGDFRTPEGNYSLTRRRIDSDYFMAIQVSYPNQNDVSHAATIGVSPGNYIMIHGQPDEPKNSASYYKKFDWTDGCIAVSNAAMVDIWQLTAANTPITILP